MTDNLLEVVNATKSYPARRGSQQTVLKDVTFSIGTEQGRIIAIAGESGSGKSTLARAVLGLHPLSSGTIRYKGENIQKLTRSSAQRYRREVQAVFQDPYGSFNPFYPVGHAFETLFRNFKLAEHKSDKIDQIGKALNVVSLRANEILDKYPHQLSGGQRQRIMMARAYVLQPKLIVADEPVSMVDASLRSMILQIMTRMKDEENISFLYITHDLATVSQVSDEIYILFRGEVVEHGDGSSILKNPTHPYTQQLVDSIPWIGKKWAGTIESPQQI